MDLWISGSNPKPLNPPVDGVPPRETNARAALIQKKDLRKAVNCECRGGTGN